MADVKTLTINNVKYDIKDETARSSLADVVHKTGTETITGDKTYTSVLHAANPAADSNDTSVATTKWARENLMNDYASKDLDNLSDTGKNFGNWSTNLSNCITHMPNNIKYTFSNGVFTLKAGSKVYVPNGPNIFTEVIVPNDITITCNQYGSAYIFVNASGTGINQWCNDGTWIYSGSSYAGGTTGMWYDTVNNVIRCTYDGGTTWSENYSFPICRLDARSDNSKWNKIQFVFQGIGFIGASAFVLPDVEYLIPAGRNTDGSCNNIRKKITSVIINNDMSSRGGDWLLLDNNGSPWFWYNREFYYDYYPNPQSNLWFLVFDSKENKWYKSDNGGAYFQAYVCLVGRYRRTGNTYYMPDQTSIQIRPVERPMDLMDLRVMLNIIYPVGSVYLEANNYGYCPLQRVMPETTWELVSSGKALWTGDGSNATSTINAGLPNLVGRLGSNGSWTEADGTLFKVSSAGTENHGWDGKRTTRCRFDFNAHDYNNIYGNSSTVQPPAYVVNVWRRTS